MLKLSAIRVAAVLFLKTNRDLIKNILIGVLITVVITIAYLYGASGKEVNQLTKSNKELRVIVEDERKVKEIELKSLNKIIKDYENTVDDITETLEDTNEELVVLKTKNINNYRKRKAIEARLNNIKEEKNVLIKKKYTAKELDDVFIDLLRGN